MWLLQLENAISYLLKTSSTTNKQNTCAVLVHHNDSYLVTTYLHSCLHKKKVNVVQKIFVGPAN